MEKPKKAKPKENPSLTDAERHARFVQMAHEVEASESEEDFEDSFNRLVRQKIRPDAHD